jgi:hypothetical protein
VLQLGQWHAARIERIINAAPSTLEAGGQTQMDRMFDDRARQERIEDLDQSITTAAEGGINVLTKGAQALKGFCVHAAPLPVG